MNCIENVIFCAALFFLVFVNGYSDAPNSVASAVGTGALNLKRARFACGTLDALGVVIFSLVLPSVAKTSGSVAKFDADGLTAISAGMISAVLWALAAEQFGIPTSEGHAMSASLAGAAFFSGGSIPYGVWVKIFFGFFVSSLAAALLSRFIRFVCMTSGDRGVNVNLLNKKRFQCLLCSMCAFLHGAQDGQKFCGLLMLGTGTEKPGIGGVLSVAAIMALGSFLCSERIVRRISTETTKPTLLGGISADASSVMVILFFTLIGIPVSTSNVKVCALAGASDGSVNLRSLFGMVLIWLATFPVCFLFGGILTRILL